MRWNTSDPSNPASIGHLQSRGLPVWLMVPEELTVPILNALLTVEHTDKQAVAEVLAELSQTT